MGNDVVQAPEKPPSKGLVPDQVRQSARLLYLPATIVRLAVGADHVERVGKEVHVGLDNEIPMSMSEEDFILASKIAIKLRQLTPGGFHSRSQIIDAVGEAHRLLSEDIFLPGVVRVLYFPQMAPGSLFYRCIMPTIAMNSGAHCKAFVSKNKVAREAADYDVVVFQIGHSAQDLQLVKELQAMGKQCVFELDDAFDALEDWHSTSDQYKRQEEIELVTAMMKTCDAVTVSTPWLAKRYMSIAKRIQVIPNMIPADDWQKADRASHLDPEFRILWAGSPSHWGDLEVVGKALTRFVTERDENGVLIHPDVKLVFFGREPVGLEVPKGSVEVHDFVDFSVYPQKLAELAADVAIAPLADVPFNHGKSNVKILEYWATGYPVVASDVGPYRDTIHDRVDGILCKTEDDWVKSLHAFYQHPYRGGQIREEGFKSVQKYNSSRLVGRVEEFFLSLAKG